MSHYCDDEGDDPAPEVPIVGFDSDGRPVPVVEPAVETPEDESDTGSLDLEVFLNVLLEAAGSPAEVGTRVALLGYLLNQARVTVPSGPHSLRDLGKLLKCSAPTAAKRVYSFRRQIAKEVAKFMPSALQPDA